MPTSAGKPAPTMPRETFERAQARARGASLVVAECPPGCAKMMRVDIPTSTGIDAPPSR